MARVKRGFKARRRRKKVLKRASGYYSSRSRLFSIAHELNDRAMVFSYRDRRTRKRTFRALWTQRINAAARLNGISYSKLIGGLKSASIELDRKSLADLAIFNATAFSEIVSQVKQAMKA